MATKKGKGIYLVWADVPADMEDDFNMWYNEEHLAELLAIPGVLSAARYVSVSGTPKYLSAYELERAEVRDTPEYKKHLIAPTEWSKKINLGSRATKIIQNNYTQIYPVEVDSEVAASEMAPFLQIGRLSITKDQEKEFNEFYNTVYAPNYAQVPGCIRFRRYTLYEGPGPKYATVYELENERVSQIPEWFEARAKSGGYLGDTFPGMSHDDGSPGVYRKIFEL